MGTAYTVDTVGTDTIYTFADLTTSDVTGAVPTLGADRLLMQCTLHDIKGPVTLQVSADGTNWVSAQERTGSVMFIAGVQADEANLNVWDVVPSRFARVLCDTTEAAVVLVVRRWRG